MSDQVPVSAPQGSGGSGLAPNVASLLCYVCSFVTGLIFLLIEKDNKEVKFHAWQSILLGAATVALYVAAGILAVIPVIGFLGTLLYLATWLGYLAVWIISMVKAYQGEHWKIPVIGDIAEQQAAK